MFRAIDKEYGTEIIILDRKWDRNNIEQLRLRGKSEMLQCPECQQHVLVKAGEQKRWHFAHQTLANCPLRNESSVVLQARSLLYQWLNSKFADKVAIEKKIEECAFPRPIDCYVQTNKGSNFVYWILESRIKNRDNFLFDIGRSNLQVHWVFLHHILRQDGKHSNKFHLSPAERDFLDYSEYGKIYHGPSLHYLKVETHELTTLRGLILVHSPQTYKCKQVLTSIMDETLVSPQTGEFVHKGEYEKLVEYRGSQNLKQEKSQTFIQSKENKFSLDEEGDLDYPDPQSIQSKSEVLSIFNEPVPCEVCGELTKDWFKFDYANKTCLCKKCVEKSY